jgi:hypothetical protein
MALILPQQEVYHPQPGSSLNNGRSHSFGWMDLWLPTEELQVLVTFFLEHEAHTGYVKHEASGKAHGLESSSERPTILGTGSP